MEDCLDTKTVIGLLALFWWLASGLSRLLKRLNQGSSSPAPAPVEPVLEDEVWEDEEEVTTAAEAPMQEAPADALAGFRAEWEERRGQVQRRAEEMAAHLVHERPNRVFLELLNRFIPEQLRHASAELEESTTEAVERGAARIQDAEFLLQVVAYLAEQRRDEGLVPMLGDTDRLAEACYRPVLTFAKSQGLGIASNRPVSVLTDFDLAIWTGLIPTTIAPIFLPRSFFERASWWPAVPHEIGHDFYASIPDFDADLRDELGYPSERDGRRIIRASGGSVDAAEIRRLFGAWLEELFCDVFATLMTGPAYVAAMLDLFSASHDPHQVTTVDLGSGGYDVHPPRHLRFLLACEILSKLGFKADVAELREPWETLHGAENLGEIIVATDVSYLAFPVEPFVEITHELAERLYRGPIRALRGRGLSGIAGLDYGPHRHNEAKRARAALLNGEIPQARDVRAVVAGAALAAHEAPEHEDQILRLAREAIPALGTGEKRVDVYDIRAPAPAGDLIGPIDARAVVQALVVSEALSRPRAR